MAERSGYWRGVDSFVRELRLAEEPVTFFDSVTGKPLFVAPQGRSMAAFVHESTAHGWPSFRDQEVFWENVRCLPNGEAVSLDGTHLGHNLPDSKGNRYCINLVSVAGNSVAPVAPSAAPTAGIPAPLESAAPSADSGQLVNGSLIN